MMTHHKRRNALILLVLALLFIMPILTAWVLFSGDHAWLLKKTVNHGQLIMPPLSMDKIPFRDPNGLPLDQHALRGKWVMLYVNPNHCGRLCRKNLYNMRQIRLALGKDRNRLQRIVVSLSKHQLKPLNHLIHRHYPGTHLSAIDKNSLAKYFKTIPSEQDALAKGYLYIVDPIGNIMMSFAPDENPHDILQDMHRLLKVSSIG